MITKSEQLKQCQLSILKEFVTLCEQMNLRYYVIGGTLLGAVRHQGFIPWDDDIDVAMPRADYDQFIDQAQSLLPNYYFLQTAETDKEYPSSFAKIRDCRTTFIETSVSRKKINHGVYIDIFPLDYYPIGCLQAGWFDFRHNVMRMRLSLEFYRPGEKFGVKRLLRCTLGSISRIIYPKTERLLKDRETLFKSVSQSALYANHCGAWGKREIAPVEWFAEGCNLMFEGLIVCAPLHYDQLLMQVYGDYMTLPPVEKRQGHHYAVAIDLDKPYTEYVKSE